MQKFNQTYNTKIIKIIIFIIYILCLALSLNAGHKIALPKSLLKISKQINLKKLKILAYSKKWLKLIHYKKKLFTGYKSQVDGKSFFLHKDGKKKPLQELITTIDFLLNNPTNYNKFPARYDLITRELNIEIPKKSSKKFNYFMNNNRTKAASIVFSSYYMNSPASVFGHSFLKLENKNSQLLDSAVDFTADTSGTGGIKSIFGGLTGYFDGQYSLISFHKKIREYNDFENRDVWLYKLKLSYEQLDFLLKHIWELKHTKYDYFFLTENCAYHILSAIEAVLPEYNLTDKTGILVLPVETLKILVKNKLIKNITNIPSLRNIFIRNYKSFNKKEKKLFRKIIKNNTLPNQINTTISIKLLDGLIDYYNFKFPSFRLDQSSTKGMKIFNFKRKLFHSRAQQSQKTNSFKLKNITKVYPPHKIHSPMRFTLFSGFNSKLNVFYIQPELRFVFHDLSDPLRGYPSNAAIDFLKLSAQIYKSETSEKISLFFKDFTLIEYTVLNDFTFFQKNLSWSIYLGARRCFDKWVKSIHGTFAPELSFQFGISKIIIGNHSLETHPSLLIFGLLKTTLNASSNFKKNKVSLGSGPLIGLKFTMTSRMIFLCQYEILKYINYSYSSSLEMNLRYQFFTNFATDISYIYSNNTHDYRLGLMFYF